MRFKIVLLSISLILLVNKAHSQDEIKLKNTFRSEYGFAFTGSGDLPGYCFSVEYLRLINKRIRIAPSIEINNFFFNEKDSYSNENKLLSDGDARSVHFSGYYYLFEQKSFKIEIGVGGYWRYWRWAYATGPNFSYAGNINLEPSSYGTTQSNALGYALSFGFIADMSRNLALNFRGVYQNDNNGDNAVTARIGLNIKF